ncbi:MAG: 6-hydroxymethylpterin diphosphokinase MptE-like protein [bacterium]
MDEEKNSQNAPRPDDAITKTLAAQDSRGQRAHWLGNIRRNQSEIAKGHDIWAIHDVFRGIPGIVIGAGPSLSRNAGQLAGAQKRYPLFCCDRANKKVFDAAGVVPHFTIVADASDKVAEFFEGYDTGRTTLIAATYVSPQVLKLPWREKVFFNMTDVDKGYESAALNLTDRRITAIPGGVIVGNIAFLIAKIAGCNPITFIGNDLSMSEPSSSPGEISYENIDASGNKIYSLPGFLAGLEWLLTFLRIDKDAASGILKVYNSTESGIMYNEQITGITLIDFIEKYPGSDRSLKTLIAKRFGK